MTFCINNKSHNKQLHKKFPYDRYIQKMQVFWDVMPCHWPHSSQCFEGSQCIGKVSLLGLHPPAQEDCLTLKINAILCFETMELLLSNNNNNMVEQPRILNHQVCCCKNLQSCKLHTSSWLSIFNLALFNVIQSTQISNYKNSGKQFKYTY